MAKAKTGDPKDGEPHSGGARFMPVGAGYGTEAIVPGPMTAGPPRPEPEERWTLAPVRRPGPPAGEDDDAAAEAAPVERVPAAARTAEGGEPDRP
jgi:hypothetical protein